MSDAWRESWENQINEYYEKWKGEWAREMIRQQLHANVVSISPARAELIPLPIEMYDILEIEGQIYYVFEDDDGPYLHPTGNPWPENEYVITITKRAANESDEGKDETTSGAGVGEVPENPATL